MLIRSATCRASRNPCPGALDIRAGDGAQGPSVD